MVLMAIFMASPLHPPVDAAGAAIDRGLAIHFPAPHSYTGEDVLELQAHGGTVGVSCEGGVTTFWFELADR